jgi:hypothetical protein
MEVSGVWFQRRRWPEKRPVQSKKKLCSWLVSYKRRLWPRASNLKVGYLSTKYGLKTVFGVLKAFFFNDYSAYQYKN